LTPGTTAATSHFDWLISITAMTVFSAEGVTPSPLAP
jgi:hypothetical protein